MRVSREITPFEKEPNPKDESLEANPVVEKY
jgi:hypothetical protein